MILITAPSKTQQSRIPEQNLPTDQFSLPVFFDHSRALNTELARLSKDQLCTLMKMSDSLGESTRLRIEIFGEELTADNSQQALFTFQGDAYSSLTPDAYDRNQLSHAQDHLRILSGLYGVLRPLDLMFPYRLEMATRLKVGSATNLYQFWGDAITENINQDLVQLAEPVVVNLASAEYSKVIRPKLLKAKILTITFKEKKGDDYRSVPIHSKRARGLMIHFMITENLTTSAPLRDFSLGGYGFRKELSTETEWVFTRG